VCSEEAHDFLRNIVLVSHCVYVNLSQCLIITKDLAKYRRIIKLW